MSNEPVHADREPIVTIGLMSGTSCDGVDAAMIRTDGLSSIQFLAAKTYPYERELREQLLRIAQSEATIDEVLRVERRMTLAHVNACKELQANAGIQAELIGFHGHTIRHQPARSADEIGHTWQIGDPNVLSEQLGCAVVSDFRRRDIAAGGEGAPLVPLFHQELLREVEKPSAVLNIGGVANVTWLGHSDSILAGDTGPGCGLLDAWVLERTGEPFDRDAKLAQQGEVHWNLVEAFVAQEYFQRALPKSADRFQFHVGGIESLSNEDGAATLCAATTTAVVQAIGKFPVPPKSLFVTGGGARNPFVMSLLGRQLNEHRACEVTSVDSLGLRVESMEAECFAWLAVRRLRGLPTSLPETTGCRVPVCGGQITGMTGSR